jgi:hypothetical protein
MTPIELATPRVLPIARDTWEVDILLPRTEERSGSVPLNFPYPGVIVGLKATVIQASSVGGLLVASPDDLKLSIDLNGDRRFTRTVRTNVTGQDPTSFVTLSALDVRERYLMIQLRDKNPDINLEVQWKRFISGTPLYEDALVSLALFIQREGESEVG